MGDRCKQCGAEAQVTLLLCRRCHGEWLMDSEEARRQVDRRAELTAQHVELLMTCKRFLSECLDLPATASIPEALRQPLLQLRAAVARAGG
jgi:predicted metal-binding protein